MLDMKFVRENPELVQENIKKKFQDAKLPLVDEVLELDEKLRAAKTEANELRANRNALSKKIGMLMGQGYTMKQAMDEVKMVVEGVYSAKAAIALARKYEVAMPIIEEINHVLFDDKPAKDAVRELMLRDRREEHSSLEWEE